MVSRSPRHVPEAHGLVPRAHPVLSETTANDKGSNLAPATAAATAGAGPGAGAGAGADPEATPPPASPVAKPAATNPAATSPAYAALDIDRHDPYCLMAARIRRNYERIADPRWADLPIPPRNRAAAAVWSICIPKNDQKSRQAARGV